MSEIQTYKEDSNIKKSSTYFLYFVGLSLFTISYLCFLYYLAPFAGMEDSIFFISAFILALVCYFYCVIIGEYINNRIKINNKRQK